MRSAEAIWGELTLPWQNAFREAWASYCDGNLGIGAVLVDPETATVVATGRNRVNSTVELPRTLSGNFMAHAEMNAFAGLDRFKADGLELYTTLQPCLMCSATAVFMHVKTVRFAATDEFFSGLGELWHHHPYSDRNKPAEEGPLESPPAILARLLPLIVQARTHPDGPVMRKAAQDIPGIAALASSAEVSSVLDRIRTADGSVEDALEALLPFLE